MDSTKNNQELTKLKNALLRKEDSNELSQVRALCQLMREVGGYDVLMNMAIPSVNEIYDFLLWEHKENDKAIKRKK